MKNNLCIILLCTCGMVLSHQSILAQKNDSMNTMYNSLLIEQTETEAWRSLLDAAPDSLRKVNGMKYMAIGGGTAINFQKDRKSVV